LGGVIKNEFTSHRVMSKYVDEDEASPVGIRVNLFRAMFRVMGETTVSELRETDITSFGVISE